MAEYNTQNAIKPKFKKLTVKGLAEKTGIARTTLIRLNQGPVIRIHGNTVEELCDFFDCEISDLLVLQKIEETGED